MGFCVILFSNRISYRITVHVEPDIVFQFQFASIETVFAIRTVTAGNCDSVAVIVTKNRVVVNTTPGLTQFEDIFLFGGTIRENIKYGDPSASEEQVKEAARQANAWEFIERFPDQLDTIVGERGTQLSGGQRQRVAIARALLKNPRILILDEATSSLDSESEKLVQEGLSNLLAGRTSIVIAHRLSTVRNADQIFVLDHGEIVESGTHRQLLRISNGKYRNLSELQFLETT